jgi:predicted MFS family arabinose efflux permease
VDKNRVSLGIVNWVLFFMGALLVFVNFFVSLTILPLYVLELGGSEFESGFQTTLFFLTAVVLRFYFGPLADRKGRKLPLLIGAFVFATAPLLFLASSTFLALTLARLYQAIGLATFLSSGSSLVADMAPPARTGSYIGKYRVLINVAFLTGPATALAIIGLKGYGPWFIVSFLIGVLAFLLLLPVKAPPLLPAEKGSYLQSITVLMKNKTILLVLAGVALTSLGYGTIVTFVSMYMGKTTDIGNPGIYFIIFGLGGIAANLLAGYLTDRFSAPAVAWPSLALIGFGTAVLFLVPKAPVLTLVVSSLLAGMGYSGALVAFIAWLVDAAGQKARATTLAFQESTIDMSIALGSFTFGLSISLLGFSASFGLMGLMILFAGAVLVFFTYRGKK